MIASRMRLRVVRPFGSWMTRSGPHAVPAPATAYATPRKSTIYTPMPIRGFSPGRGRPFCFGARTPFLFRGGDALSVPGRGRPGSLDMERCQLSVAREVAIRRGWIATGRYPFTPVIVTPWMKWRWAKKNVRITGRVMIIEPAMMSVN